MDTKKLLVSLSLAVLAIFMVATVSAAEVVQSGSASVEVDSIDAYANQVAVVAGDNIAVVVEFTADVNASDVKVKLELEGDKVDTEVVSQPFDIEAGKTYRKALKLEIPFELKDQLSDDVTLSIKVWNGD